MRGPNIRRPRRFTYRWSPAGSELLAILGCVIAEVVLLAIAVNVGMAFAQGFNDSGYNYTIQGDGAAFPGNSGLYVRDPVTDTHVRAYQGPHGGYRTTTNECRDCHASHMSSGVYKFTRSNTREHVCDYCHCGGGGSAINIQMDNIYDDAGLLITGDAGAGNGHSIGYTRPAPLDIRPAFVENAGFTCTDCHSPHGSSARLLTTFADVGHRTGGPEVCDIHSDGTLLEVCTSPEGIDLSAYNGGRGSFWGISVTHGNIVTVEDGSVTEMPIFPTGRFLLLRDPHSTANEGAEDTRVGSAPGSDVQLGFNKVPIDWDDPIGPADASNTGDQSARHGGSFYGSQGLLDINEICTDCHDGAAGASSQRATVWYREGVSPAGGVYAVAYSHDSQPRDHMRQMILNPGGTPSNPGGTDDNFGPNCRGCHSGASSCDQCHGVDGVGNPGDVYQAFVSTYAGELPPSQASVTPYWAQASVNKSAVTGNDGRCVDAGFTWPHRTLGANLLGDELYGVDFDGTVVAAGEYRTDPNMLEAGYMSGQDYAFEPTVGMWMPAPDPTSSIALSPAENLDSLCITCHGDATYWAGDTDTHRITTPSEGWELVLKGLP
jgi:hypothetical protein